MKFKRLLSTVTWLFFIPVLVWSQQNVVWTDLVNINANENTLNKSAARGWNVGATSTNKISSNSDGWMETKAKETTTYRAIGLSKTNKDLGLRSIEFAVYFLGNSTLRVTELGVSKITITYTSNDILRIERVSSQILYKKNGATFYTSTLSTFSELIVDASLNSKNSTLTDVKVFSGDTGGDTGGENVTNSLFINDDDSSDGAIRYSGGKVIIGEEGTNKIGNFNLYVQGGLLTEMAKVAIRNTSSWADYVFEDNYSLNKIDDVENFIKEQKHLPNVPSAEQVVKEGINVAEMDATLLRQIEELWLHIIELNKKNKQLQTRLNLLENK